MKLLYDTAVSFLYTPYKWGGESFRGFDCSGLVQEILASAGVDPPGDQTAQKLYEHFSENENHVSSEPQLGALAFYGKSTADITHVAFLLNKYRMIEAAGGGSSILTISDAAFKDAKVRVRPLRLSNLQDIYLPDYDSVMR